MGNKPVGVDDTTSLFPTRVMNALRSVLTGRPSYAASRTGVFNQQRSVYNFQPSNTRKIRSGIARARAGTGMFRIGGAGEQTMAGQGSSPLLSWLPLFAGRLAVLSGTAFNPFVVANCNVTDPRWTFDSNWTPTSANGSHIRTTTTNGAVATYTSRNAGTIAQVAYLNNSGSFNVSVDGGAATSIVPPGGTGVVYWTSAALTSGTHTITITATSTAPTYIVGAGVSSTTGVALLNGAIGGSSTYMWNNSDSAGPDYVIRSFTPDVVFLEVQINDVTGAQAVADWSNRYQSAITLLQGASSTPDIVLCSANPISGYDLTAYTAELYRLADVYNLPLIDFQADLVSYAAANADGLMADTTNPNQVGNEVKALTVRNGMQF